MDTLEVNFDRAFGQAKHLCDLLEARRFSIAMLCSDANSAAAATRRGSMGSRIVNENPNTLDAFWLTLRQTTNLTGSA